MFRPQSGRRLLPLIVLSGIALPAAAQSGGSPVVAARGNELACAIDNQGALCNEQYHFGGSWPYPSQNMYIYNAGIAVAGIVAADAGFEWAGDTVPAYFHDLRGIQGHGTALTNVFSSIESAHLELWPRAGDIAGFPFADAYASGDIFHEIHASRRAISEQDTWVMYWDGDPALNAHREHPLGVAVEQRTLQWEAPEGLQSMMIVVQRLTNVTNLPVFRDTMVARYFGGDSTAVPADGWRIDSLFVGMGMDADVSADITNNYVLLLPGIDVALAYNASFTAPEFEYPGEIFYPPFLGNAPGLVATALLHADADPATASPPRTRMMSTTENPGSCTGLCDPLGADLWRYLSGHLGDLIDACNVPDPAATRACYQPTNPWDVRHFQSVGPYSLDAGESVTVVFALVAAPTADVPGLAIGGDNPPEAPSLTPGCNGEPIGMIAAAAGWLGTPACPSAGGPLDPDRIETLPGSLLDRIQVARAFVREGFLTPFAPEPPPFAVVPGDGQVSVVWSASPTEENGDPFHRLASDSASALFNPNYRFLDVEGYRIYRSTDGVNFARIAQFDQDTTVFVDHLCETDPEWADGDPCEGGAVQIHDRQGMWPLYDPLRMFRPGDRRRLGPDQVAILDADTVNTALQQFALEDGGVPYAFIDHDVRNGFRYYYRVTAFDVNSYRSGPSSMESVSATVRSAVPRTSLAAEPTVRIELRAANGEPLDTTGYGTLDPVSGRFTGPPPPTDAFDADLTLYAPYLLKETSVEVVLDSIVPAYYGGDYFLTMPSGQTVRVPSHVPNASAGPLQTRLPLVLLASDSSRIGQADSLPESAAGVNLSLSVGPVHWHSGDADWAPLVPGFWQFDPPSGAVDGGSRWFSGDNEEMSHPTLELRHGSLPGTQIFQPTPFYGLAYYTSPFDGQAFSGDLFRRFYQTTWAVRRVADIELRWGSGGLDGVFDATHRVPVPFDTRIRASYGFLDDADGDGVLTYADFYYVPGLETAGNTGYLSRSYPTRLSAAPRIMPVDIDGDLAADGSGFGIYIAGEPYLFETSSVPRNTTWTLRTHHGAVVRGGDVYELHAPGVRTPGVPGLRLAIEVEAAAQTVASTDDLRRVHTVPDPYYVRSHYGSESGRTLRFVNLPPDATIRIYSVSGILVDVLHHRDATGGGTATWDLRTRDGHAVASGVYFFHVAAPGGAEHTGRFTVISSRLTQ